MAKKGVTLSERELVEKGHLYYLRHISIDNVIFGFHDNELKVLLLEWKESSRWCLPGGFILKDEAVEDAAIRILQSRTGLRDIYLNQFYTFGDPQRDRGNHGIQQPKWMKTKSWFMERFITIGYWALVDFSQVVPKPDEFSASCRWWDVDKVPELILDHNEILTKALQSLRSNLNEYPVGKDLLPQKFTMPELQKLYETILDKKLDRRNFQRRMMGYGIVKRLSETRKGGAHKAPYLYSFDLRKYKKALQEGLQGGW